MLAIDLPTRSLKWREPFGESSARLFDGFQVWADAPMAVSPTGESIFLGTVFQGTERGIVALDLSTRRTVKYAGPFAAHAGFASIRPTSRFPRGALVVGASRDRNEARGVYLLDPVSLSVTDSVPPSVMGPDRLVQVVASGDSVLYLTGRTTLRRLDLSTKQVTATAMQGNGLAALTSDAKQIVLTDFGVWPDSPGSGVVRVLDTSTLSVIRTIQLPNENGLPRVSLVATSGFRPEQAFVTTGTAARGPLYGVQPSGLLELDVVAGVVRRFIRLGDFGSVVAYVY